MRLVQYVPPLCRYVTTELIISPDFTTFDIIGDMAFGEPFGCLREGKFHSWVSLITQTIKAGAFEQATRRMFKTGSTMQQFLCKFIPESLRRQRVQHLELSKEKCLK